MFKKLIQYKWSTLATLVVSLLFFAFVDEGKTAGSLLVHIFFGGFLSGIGLGSFLERYRRKIRYRTLGAGSIVAILLWTAVLVESKPLSHKFSLFILTMSLIGIGNIARGRLALLLPNRLAAQKLDQLSQTVFFERRLPFIIETCQQLIKDGEWVKGLAYHQKTMPKLLTAKKQVEGFYQNRLIGATIYETAMEDIRNAEVALDKLLGLSNQYGLETDHILLELNEADIVKIAPEIQPVYHRIMGDHQSIIRLIDKADLPSKKELLTVQTSRMKQFEDIVKGYLKIKSNREHYYDAEERLTKAKATLDQFDKELDEILRQLNESNMMDFEVSLRLLSQNQSPKE